MKLTNVDSKDMAPDIASSKPIPTITADQDEMKILHTQDPGSKDPEILHRVYPRSWQYVEETPEHHGQGSAQVSFTVMTYNVLTDICMPKGEYQYCPEDIRYMADRHPYIMSEIDSMKPDVMCLQEVDNKHFYGRLMPDIAQRGYQALYYQRADDQGLTVLYRDSVFAVLQHKHCVLHRSADTYIQKANISESTRNTIRKCIVRPMASVMVKLQHRSSGHIVSVANIHVAWEDLKHPALQALQISCATNELVEFAGGPDNAHILCGDFNTPPHFPAYRMLTDGQMGEAALDLFDDLRDVELGRQRNSYTENEDNESEDLAAHGLVNHLPDAFKLKAKLHSAYKTVTGHEPPITSCDDCGLTERVKLCLDYLWFSSGSLGVTGVLLTPPVESILKHYALPSILFPSDHIPLQARFAFP